MRALLPYLIAATVIAILTGVAYGAGWIDAGAAYGGIILSCLAVLPAADRWSAQVDR